MSEENASINVIDPNLDLDKLAVQMGVDMPQDALQDEGFKNTGFSFYQHKLGNYVGLIGKLGDAIWTKEVDGKNKKCEKGEPGAVKSYSMLPIMIVEDPEGKLVDDTFTPLPDIQYGKIMWQQYVTLNSEKQYNNKRLFAEIKYDNLPQLDIVQGGQNDYNIKLELLKHFYYGAPVTFTLDKTAKAKSAWIVEGTLLLRNTVLTKDVIERRKLVADSLMEKIQQIKEAEDAERKAKKGGAGAEGMKTSDEDAASADSMLKETGFEL